MGRIAKKLAGLFGPCIGLIVGSDRMTPDPWLAIASNCGS
jgi:hypothetical protein